MKKLLFIFLFFFQFPHIIFVSSFRILSTII